MNKTNRHLNFLKKFLTLLLTFVLVVFALLITSLRLYDICKDNSEEIGVAAAGLVFTKGSRQLAEEEKDTTSSEQVVSVAENIYSDTTVNDTSHDGERMFSVIESRYSASGVGYDNFYVKNTADVSIDIGSLLKSPLDFKITDTVEPQVLIVHTHTTESYMDSDVGYYYESYTGRSGDDSKNVVAVGNAIAKKLKDMGIGVLHITTHHDDPGYNGSYSRSRESIENALKEYPSIKTVFDIHRDALSSGDEGIIKPTFSVNGKKAAQIMIMSGCDTDGSLDFDFWQENLKFALKLQQKAETLYPGMTRPLYFGNFAYNMNINSGSLLIEVGTHANTLDEAVYSGELLGNVIAQVLKENA